MKSHPVQMLDPVFRFLDDLIRDYGHLLYMGLVYAAIPLCAWILFGGSRRKSSEGQSSAPLIVIHQPAERRESEEDFNPFPPPREPDWSGDDDRHWD